MYKIFLKYFDILLNGRRSKIRSVHANGLRCKVDSFFPTFCNSSKYQEAKEPGGKSTGRQKYREAKVPGGKSTGRQKYREAIVPGGNSTREAIVPFLRGGKSSGRQKSQEAKVQEASVPGGKNTPGGKSSGGKRSLADMR